MSDVNYNIAPANPIPGMMQALQLGTAIGGIRDARAEAQAAQAAAQAAAQQKAQKDAQIVNAFNVLHTNPTAENYAALANLQPPEIAESTRKTFAMLDEASAAKTLKESADVFAAFKSGNKDLALKLLKEKAEAYRNARNEKGATDTQRLYDLAVAGDVGAQGVEDFFGLMIAQMPNGKDAIEAIVKFSQEQRDDTTAGKLAADQKAGTLDPDKRFNYELSLNKEYTTRTKGFTDALRLDSVIKDSAKDQSGAGDLALVTTFMKMLDPGSVVRESEFAAAQDTSGLLGKLMSTATKIQNGQILTPDQRKDFARLAGQYMTASAEHEKKARKDLEYIVKNYGLNKENVFGTMADKTTTPTAAGLSLRDYIKQNWPDEVADIDKLSDEQLKAKYIKTTEKYNAGQGNAQAEPVIEGGF